jgi:TrmH family RNA methyltransferase
LKAISSDANPAFRRWLRIATTPRAVRAEGRTLAEGLHLAQAALEAGFPIEAVLVRRGAAAAGAGAGSGSAVERLLAACAAGGVDAARVHELAPALYDRLVPVEQGAGLMLVVPVPEAPLPRKSSDDLVYLDGVQDPGNVGALIRSAAAAGVGHVLAAPGTAALWAPKVLRAGMGAHFRIGLHEQVLPGQLAGALAGDWIAAVAHGAPALWREPLPDGAVGWIFGAEGSGPSADALAASRRRVTIPASSAVESLNVAAAAAVCLFERLRRRDAAQ